MREASENQGFVVPLGSKRRERAAAMQKFNHVLPAMALLGEGLNAFHEGAHGYTLWLAVVSIVAGSLFVVSMARGVRRAMREKRHGAPSHALHHPHGIDWPDVFAAGVLAVEALDKWHTKHHLSRPTILTAMLTLAIGLFQGRMITFMEQRRALRVSDAGISIGARPFRRALKASWPDVASVEIGERYASIRTREGQERRIDLADVRDADRVRAALSSARQRLGPSTNETL